MRKRQKQKKFDYTHKNEKRANNPPAGLAEGADAESQTYTASVPRGTLPPPPVEDYHDPPVLEWKGKHDTDEFEVETAPLHVHESIHPVKVLDGAMKQDTTLDDFFGLQRPRSEAVEFYEHEDGWTNRLISGESLAVMNSLLQKESLVAGRVQMIYYDPPYGIKFDSNFNPTVFGQTKEDMEKHPRQVTAFRDTWEYEAHSYLTMMRQRLELARRLLAQTGSIFVQISNEHVHRVRLLLDETFGVENFVWEVLFQKTTGGGQGTHPSPYDYILWYARDKAELKASGKLHQLYLERSDKQMKRFNQIRMPNGRFISVPEDGKVPRGGKRCRRDDRVTSQGASTTDRSDPHTFPNGKTVAISPDSQWRISHEALDKLYEMDRLYFTGDSVWMIAYPEDYPTIMTNVWDGLMLGSGKIYAVQTAHKVIERCIALCSDPGDLVMDITGGSGTTAYAAESLGRRWITCDTSKTSLVLGRWRLMTAVFPWYELRDENAGICGGLQYEMFVKRTAGVLSSDGEPEPENRYDKPLADRKRSRVAGPFTVEAVPSPVVLSGVEKAVLPREEWADKLLHSGVVGMSGGRVRFSRLERNRDERSVIHYVGTTTTNRELAVSFGPRNDAMGHIQVEAALRAARQMGIDVMFVASQFDPLALDVIRSSGIATATEAHGDLLIPELKSRDTDESFVLVGQPRFDVSGLDADGDLTVKLLGYDYYDPEKGALHFGGTDDVAMWMLDTDYDGRTMRAKQIFFPGNVNSFDKLAKELKRTLRGLIDAEALKKYVSTESLPFKMGKYKTIAIKTVDNSGRDAIATKEIGSW